MQKAYTQSDIEAICLWKYESLKKKKEFRNRAEAQTCVYKEY